MFQPICIPLTILMLSAGMGGRIFVVDRHRRNIAKRPASSATYTTPLAISILATLAAMAAVALRR